MAEANELSSLLSPFEALQISPSDHSLPQPSKAPGEDASSLGLSAVSSSGQGNSVEGHDQQRTRLIQQQLVLLLHANKCLQRVRENPAHTCNLSYCHTMKDVLRHMMHCQESRNCSYNHCVSSRQIIMHWKQCRLSNCFICGPVKETIKPGSVHEGGDESVGGAWQNAVQRNLRDHLIKRMLQGIYPAQNYEAAQQNPQYMQLVVYFKRIEEEFFNTCRNKEEYFSKLADKYKQVQAEIHRKQP
jgi:E1A/CREB-binding protein